MNTLCLCCHNKVQYLKQTLEGILTFCSSPYEVIIVDDNSTDEEVLKLITNFTNRCSQKVTVLCNEQNLGHAKSQNKAFENASKESNVLIHIEDDIVIKYPGWNQVFENYLNEFPELGMICPRDSGRGPFLQRKSYREIGWGLGAIWGIRREVYENVGVFDINLPHQLETDLGIRIRMDGWRIGEVKEFNFLHLCEGDPVNPLKREAQIHEGVWCFLKKWNKRLIGVWDYGHPFSQIWTQFPISRFFYRLISAQVNQRIREVDDDDDRMSIERMKQYVDNNVIFKDGSLRKMVEGKSFADLVDLKKDVDFIWIYLKNKEDLKKLKDLGIEFGR